MDYSILQHYWWFVVSLLGALLVFLLFVQGGQSFLFSLGKKELENKMLVNSTGRKWEFTFTTLVTFGGAFFASFPLFYSTSFGGAYWVWIIILFSFIIQAVSYEFQSKKGNLLGKKTYQVFLLINGVLAPVLLGAAVATFFTGSAFSIDMDRMFTGGVISQWENPFHGLEAVLNPWNVILGLAVFFLSRVTALLYFINNISDENVDKSARKRLIPNVIAFLVFFLAFVGFLLTTKGFAVNLDTKEVFMMDYKYFINFIEMPAVLGLFLVGVLLVLFGIGKTIFCSKFIKGIWFEGTGVVFTVLALFLVAGWNNTSFYPSTFDLQSSLTIENSSSSEFTLIAMSFVSILVPFVLAYIIYAWRALDLRKIDAKEMQGDDHAY